MRLRGILFVCAGLFIFTHSAAAGMTHDERKQLRTEEQPFRLPAVEELPVPVTLDDAVAFGLRGNDGLKAAFYRWKAAAKMITKEQSLDDPAFAVKTFIQEIETRLGPQKQMYSVSQKIPFPGKLLLKGQIATEKAREDYAAFQKKKLQLMADITVAYTEYWYIENSIRTYTEIQALLEQFENVAQEKFKSGMARNQDLLKAQIELGLTANQVLSLTDQARPLRAKLNRLLGRPYDAPVTVSADLPHTMVDISDEQALARQADERNPDLMRATHAVRENEKRVQLARLKFLPDVMIGVDYTSIGKAPMPVDNSGNDAVALSVKVNVPLWFWKQASELASARAARTAAAAASGQARRDAETLLQTACYDIRNAERNINLYDDALVPKVEQTLQATQTAYRSGTDDFLSLLDAERQLLQFRLMSLQAAKNYEQATAALAVVIGGPLANKEGAA